MTSPFVRRFRLLTLLRGSLVAGALYDLAFAVLMVAAPQVPARILKLPLPPLPRQGVGRSAPKSPAATPRGETPTTAGRASENSCAAA